MPTSCIIASGAGAHLAGGQTSELGQKLLLGSQGVFSPVVAQAEKAVIKKRTEQSPIAIFFRVMRISFSLFPFACEERGARGTGRPLPIHAVFLTENTLPQAQDDLPV
jgi:hypothetical protein